jgi:hypothetical protein
MRAMNPACIGAVKKRKMAKHRTVLAIGTAVFIRKGF